MSTKQTEALKLALLALEECRRDPRLKYEHPYYDKAITAIREALADSALDRMAENARELGLDYEPPCKTGSQCTNKCQQCEQPAPVPKAHEQQKPAARQYQGRDGVWRDFISEKHYKDTLEDGSWPIRDLYASPPPNTNAGKPWVGLTQEERDYIWHTVGNSDAHGDVDGWSGRDVMDAIEAKLKEKNAAPCKPLTDAEIEKICPKFEDPVRREMWVLGFKAAHGIMSVPGGKGAK